MPSRCLKHSAGDPGRKACSPVTFRRKTAARPESRRGVREASRDFTRGAPVSGGGSRRRRMLGARHPLPIWPPVHARPGPLGSGGVASSLPTSELNSFSLFRQRCSAQGLYHENRSTDANLHGLGHHPPDRSFWARLVEIANSQPVGAEASLVFCFHWSAFMSIKHTFFFFFFFLTRLSVGLARCFPDSFGRFTVTTRDSGRQGEAPQVTRCWSSEHAYTASTEGREKAQHKQPAQKEGTVIGGARSAKNCTILGGRGT